MKGGKYRGVGNFESQFGFEGLPTLMMSMKKNVLSKKHVKRIQPFFDSNFS